MSFYAAILPCCWKWSPSRRFIATFLKVLSKTRSVCCRRSMIEWQLFTQATELQESPVWRFLAVCFRRSLDWVDWSLCSWEVFVMLIFLYWCCTCVFRRLRTSAVSVTFSLFSYAPCVRFSII